MTRARALNLYIALIGVFAAATFAVSVYAAAVTPWDALLREIPVAAIFCILGILGSRQQVLVSQSTAHLMGTTAQIAALIVLPLPLAIVTITVAKISSELTPAARTNSSRKAFTINVGAAMLAAASAGLAYHVLHAPDYLFSPSISVVASLPGLVGLGILYYVVDTLIIVRAVSLSTAESLRSAFVLYARDAYRGEASLILVGVVFGVLWHFNPFLSVFVAVPVVFSVRSFQSAARLRRETVEAVLKMAESIDYRDTGTYEHSERLTQLSTRLATSLGLSPEHVEEISLASKVHDLGKIGISNDILLKTGPLTPEERAIMEEHPVIGANILVSYSAFQGSVPIVRHHHERWDGNGYPDGLAGEAIPIGARILTVVDSFDAMTSDRPYRKGMSVREAVERLKAGMGGQFDARVCAAFIQMLIDDGVYLPAEPPALRIVPDHASKIG
ncbi:MAG TPA: HD-GYP domain-containing protein [Chloroflexota bacterium]|nr:HD-GYP domain-containing protein [Chloroflexota bacterium]